jgi:hypothetical protein
MGERRRDSREKAAEINAHLLENAFIQPVRDLDQEDFEVLPNEVRSSIQSGDRSWGDLVPDRVVHLIERCECPGLKTHP